MSEAAEGDFGGLFLLRSIRTALTPSVPDFGEGGAKRRVGLSPRYDLCDPTRLGAARGATLPEDGEGFKHHAGAPDFTSL